MYEILEFKLFVFVGVILPVLVLIIFLFQQYCIKQKINNLFVAYFNKGMASLVIIMSIAILYLIYKYDISGKYQILAYGLFSFCFSILIFFGFLDADKVVDYKFKPTDPAVSTWLVFIILLIMVVTAIGFILFIGL